MYPLLICSVISLAIIIERAVSLRKRAIIRPELVRLIQDIRDVSDVPMAFSKCQIIRGPFSNIIKNTLINLHLSWEEKLHEIQVAGKEEAKYLERNLNFLEILATVTPLLGLFGTVLGMDEIFAVIGSVGLGEPRAFSYGISQALRTTIFGLAIAIPTSVAASIYNSKVDSLVNDMERLSTILLNKLYASKARIEKPIRLEELKIRGHGEKA
jgi:biopolymer transport protein ExbB